MQFNREWIEGRLNGKSMRAYRVRPQAAGDKPLPTVLVIQEIWGVDEHIQDMADRFAAAGYEAIAPDLFSYGDTPAALKAPRIQAVKRFLDTMPPAGWGNPDVMQQHLDTLPADEAQKIQETQKLLFGPKDEENFIAQLKQWTNRGLEHGPAVLSIGYCMGGRLAFLLACHDQRIKAAVCNYGTAPSDAELAQLQSPVYGFYGGTDHRITDAVPGVAEKLKELGKTFHYAIYPEAGHAFFNDSRASYDVDAARQAWSETLHFFDQVLAH